MVKDQDHNTNRYLQQHSFVTWSTKYSSQEIYLNQECQQQKPQTEKDYEG